MAERRNDERVVQGYVMSVVGALAGAVVSGLVGVTIVLLVVRGHEIGPSLDDLMESVGWGIFLLFVVLPTVCFVVGGGGTYLLLRFTGHSAPLRTAFYTVVLAFPCVFVAGKLTDGVVSLILALVAASLIARRLALAST